MKILGVAKAALYGIFLNYYCYYVLQGSFIPRGTVLFFGVACLGVGADILQRRYVHVGKEIKSWILYALFSVVTTALITTGSSVGFIEDIAKFVQRLMIIMMVAYICEREGSIRFGLRLMAVTAVAAAISILMVTEDIRLKLSLTTEANLSANDIGALMAFGCFAVMFAWGKRGKSSLCLAALKTAGFICCVIIIFLAGSRKSIIAVVIMLVLLLLLCLRDSVDNVSLKRFFVVLLVGAAAYWVITEYLLQYAEQTNLYGRLFGDNAAGAADSDQGRIRLYVLALEDFAAHPLFGLGFNQYVKYHGNYTHSTYAEPLACSGLIGLFYLYPYFSMLRKQVYLIRRNKPGSLARLKQKEIFTYLCMALFVGIGIPYMYKDIPCILLGTIIASQTISFRELRERGYTSADY